MNLPGSSIQTKLAVATMLLVAMISIFIYAYFPARLREQASRITADEAHAVSQLWALTVAPGLATNDVPEVYRALSALRENPDLVYAVVFQNTDRPPFAVYNLPLAEQYGFRRIPMEPRRAAPRPRSAQTPSSLGGFTDDERIYQVSVPIRDRGQEIGQIYLGLSTDRLRAEVASSYTTVTGVAIAIFAVGMLFAIAISRAIARPLRAMAGTTKRIAGGDLSERARVEGRDEVAQLARSFNTMIDRLEQAQDELAAWNKTLEQRVEERTRELRDEMTERRRAERRYRLLFERNLSGVYITDV
ncbi:MAG TPA: HAMP domain-containing protein, partial [Thermoanaerobaculia bacterium]|nr:HAMP domain-containing protein [Thermoanaerobaculia bacterium]